MASFLKDMMKSEPQSLQVIRTSLDSALNDKRDFISLLKEHHDYLEESIAVLIDKEASDSDKQSNLYRFFRLVEMHGKAEQETLYVGLKHNQDKEARLEGLGGQDEHDVAFQLEGELTEMGYQTRWTEEIAAKAKVVAGLVKNHIKQEESTLFPVARKNIAEPKFESLRTEYVEKCKSYLDDGSLSMGRRGNQFASETRVFHS